MPSVCLASSLSLPFIVLSQKASSSCPEPRKALPLGLLYEALPPGLLEIDALQRPRTFRLDRWALRKLRDGPFLCHSRVMSVVVGLKRLHMGSVLPPRFLSLFRVGRMETAQSCAIRTILTPHAVLTSTSLHVLHPSRSPQIKAAALAIQGDSKCVGALCLSFSVDSSSPCLNFPRKTSPSVALVD